MSEIKIGDVVRIKGLSGFWPGRLTVIRRHETSPELLTVAWGRDDRIETLEVSRYALAHEKSEAEERVTMRELKQMARDNGVLAGLTLPDDYFK